MRIDLIFLLIFEPGSHCISLAGPDISLSLFFSLSLSFIHSFFWPELIEIFLSLPSSARMAGKDHHTLIMHYGVQHNNYMLSFMIQISVSIYLYVCACVCVCVYVSEDD